MLIATNPSPFAPFATRHSPRAIRRGREPDMPDPLLNKLLLAPASTPAATSGRPSPAAGSASAGGNSFSNALERRMSAAEREPARTRAVATGRGPERRETPPVSDRDRGRELRRKEDAATADRAQEVQPRIDRDTPAEAVNATSASDGETGSEDRASAVEVQQQPTSSLVPAAESIVTGESAAPPPDTAFTASFAGLVPPPAAVIAAETAVAGDQAVSAPVLQDGTERASAVPLLEKLIAEVTAAPGEAHGGSGERLNVAGRSAQGDANRGLAALLPAPVEAQLPDSAGAIPGPPGDASFTTGGPATSVPGAGFNAAVRSEPVSQLPVHTPAGQQRAWAEEIGNRVVWLVGRNESKAELVLTPPQMGKLEVSIHVSGDQTVAHFVAATSAARDALEQAMPRLREMMQQAGISLGETSVGTSDGQQAGQESPSGRHARGPASGAASGVETGAPVPMSVDWSRAGTGRVDTFA
ncbi:flagellar hook-length control protein FliK [Aromatoleum buckelii]|uniref:Flagellar hook-length control protein-like C-terminal domain-containing protein n=1 Tax=Aromatoleum buckelii TaxID=200254 RepID=A0ABX1N2D6_9RHOO|nr:flagellar hook-length control protein FliK [Aromatoleum buckelii]MCK0510906.1 flagellar hook-length control protein FliK [Aromatoleum buckelii]